MLFACCSRGGPGSRGYKSRTTQGTTSLIPAGSEQPWEALTQLGGTVGVPPPPPPLKANGHTGGGRELLEAAGACSLRQAQAGELQGPLGHSAFSVQILLPNPYGTSGKSLPLLWASVSPRIHQRCWI